MLPINLGTLAASLSLLISSATSQVDQFTSNIPPEEAAALAQIVEDGPADAPMLRKDSTSPEYSLIYKVPLPIPPVKQPKK
jgi:bilirubin oxidase